MNAGTFADAVQLARKLGHIFVATADHAGRPHLAAAGKLVVSGEEEILVAAWFCPTTVANLQENPRIALIVWDPQEDRGYQIIGESRKVAEIAMMNGFVPEKDTPLPQVEREISVRVDRILEFTRAPHTDLEEPL